MQTTHTLAEFPVKRRTPSHPGDSALRAIARGEGSAAARRHLEACFPCSDLLATLSELLKAGTKGGKAACPEVLGVVRLATDGDGIKVSADASHLAACTSCARELLALERLDALPSPPTSASWLDRLRSLVSFEMPLHLALQVRRIGAPPVPVYDRAMRAYRDGDFVEALRDLDEVATDPKHAPAVDFFSGACHMRQGRSTEAVVAFAAAVRGRTRLGEYRWYLGQAQLVAGHVDDAKVTLTRVMRTENPFREPARELLRRLGEVQAELKKGDRVPTRTRRNQENG